MSEENNSSNDDLDREKINEKLEELKKSIEERKKRFFNPTWTCYWFGPGMSNFIEEDSDDSDKE